MKTCNKAPFIGKLMYVTLLSVLEAQQDNEVTGYLGQDVTLTCQFSQSSEEVNVTQSQWDLLQPDGKPITIVVSSSQFGAQFHDSPLKGKAEINEQSLIIKDLEKRDEGLYRCSVSTFPLGSFDTTTKLVVREPSSPGIISAVVISVLLLVGIMAASVYLMFIKRCDSSCRHHVFCGDMAAGGARSSVVLKDQDVVYSDVKFKPFSCATPSSNQPTNQNTNTMDADVTYAKVVLGQQPKSG